MSFLCILVLLSFACRLTLHLRVSAIQSQTHRYFREIANWSAKAVMGRIARVAH